MKANGAVQSSVTCKAKIWRFRLSAQHTFIWVGVYILAGLLGWEINGWFGIGGWRRIATVVILAGFCAWTIWRRLRSDTMYYREGLAAAAMNDELGLMAYNQLAQRGEFGTPKGEFSTWLTKYFRSELSLRMVAGGYAHFSSLEQGERAAIVMLYRRYEEQAARRIKRQQRLSSG